VNDGPTDPFFIVGAARSGTTVMRLALNAHPRLAVPSETNFFLNIWPRHDPPRDWPHAVNSFMALCERRLRPSVDLEPIRTDLLSRRHADFRDLLALPLAAWARNEGKSRWGEKTPEHIFYGAQIARLFPRAKVIEITRDPRAAVASMNRSVFRSDDSTRNALYWRYVMRTGHTSLIKAMGAGQVMSVRYEDLVSDPEQTLRAVCDFLGEDFETDMLAFHERASNYLPESRSSADPKLAKPVEANLSGWRKNLSQKQVAVIESICRREMEALGYSREGRSPAPAERVEIAGKTAYTAFKHVQQRGKPYHVITAPPVGRLRRTASNAPPTSSRRPA
jgi:hypothetical protein